MLVVSTFECPDCHVQYRTMHDPKKTFECPSCGAVIYEPQPSNDLVQKPKKKFGLFGRKSFNNSSPEID